MVGTSRQRQEHQSCQQRLSPFPGPYPFSHMDKKQCTQHPRGIPAVFKRRWSPNDLWLLPYQQTRVFHRVPPLWVQTSLGNVLVYPSLTIRQRRRLTGCPIMSAVLGGGEATVEGTRAGGLLKMAVIMRWTENYDPASLACPESATVDEQIKWSPAGL